MVLAVSRTLQDENIAVTSNGQSRALFQNIFLSREFIGRHIDAITSRRGRLTATRTRRLGEISVQHQGTPATSQKGSHKITLPFFRN